MEDPILHHACSFLLSTDSPEEEIFFEYTDDTEELFFDANEPEEAFYDTQAMPCQENIMEQPNAGTEFFYDPFYEEEPRPGTAFHLSINYDKTLDDNINTTSCCVSQMTDDAFLDDSDYYKLTGHHEEFDTLVCAISTVENM